MNHLHTHTPRNSSKPAQTCTVSSLDRRTPSKKGMLALQSASMAATSRQEARAFRRARAERVPAASSCFRRAPSSASVAETMQPAQRRALSVEGAKLVGKWRA